MFVINTMQSETKSLDTINLSSVISTKTSLIPISDVVVGLSVKGRHSSRPWPWAVYNVGVFKTTLLFHRSPPISRPLTRPPRHSPTARLSRRASHCQRVSKNLFGNFIMEVQILRVDRYFTKLHVIQINQISKLMDTIQAVVILYNCHHLDVDFLCSRSASFLSRLHEELGKRYFHCSAWTIPAYQQIRRGKVRLSLIKLQ